MKKLFMCLLASLSFVVMAFGFAACANGENEHNHTLVEHVGTDPTCTQPGNLHYWECSDCGNFYLDETAKELATSETVVVAALGHTLGDWLNEVAAENDVHGVKGHYTCAICEKDFDEDGVTEITNLTVHALSHVDATSSACETDGCAEHYACSICKKTFADEKGEIALTDIVQPAIGHDLHDVAKKDATCTELGYTAHKACSRCGYKEDYEEIPALYSVKKGAFKDSENGFKSTTGSALIVDPNGTFSAGTINFTMNYDTNGWHGVVFALSDSINAEWENVDYYFAGINNDGNAMLVKVLGTTNAKWNLLTTAPLSTPADGFNFTVLYKEGHISLYLEDTLLINYQDNDYLTGSGYGFRTEFANTTFSDFEFEQDNNVVLPDFEQFEGIEGFTTRNGNFKYKDQAYIAAEGNSILEGNNAWNGGTIEYDFKMGNNADTGLIFGITKNGDPESYWESGVSYYMAVINATGIGFAAINWNNAGWSWLVDPGFNRFTDYSANKVYHVVLKWNPEQHYMTMTVDNLSISYSDTTSPLTGRAWGFRAGQQDNAWSHIDFTNVKPENPFLNFTTRQGSFAYRDSFYIVSADGSAILESNNVWKGGTIEYDFKMGTATDTGVIFGITKSGNPATYWENGVSYYMAVFNATGIGFAAINWNNAGWNWLVDPMSARHTDFAADKTYHVVLAWNPEQHYMTMKVGELSISYTDNTSPLSGTAWGFRGTKNGNAWKLTNTSDVKPEAPGSISGFAKRQGDFTAENNAYTTAQARSILESKTAWSGGTVEYDFKMGTTADTGFIFGITNPNKADTYWETTGVSYYMAFINQNGIGIAAVYDGKWTLHKPCVNAPFSDGFDANRTYHVTLSWNAETGEITVSTDAGNTTSFTVENKLNGTGWGFRGAAVGHTWSNVEFK